MSIGVQFSSIMPLPFAAVFFDCDGLMIDSEPLWARAQIEVFSSLGVPMTIETTILNQGVSIDNIVSKHYSPFRQQQSSSSNNSADGGNNNKEMPPDIEVVKLVNDRVTALMTSEGQAKPGLLAAIEFFSSHGIPMAVVSSSRMPIVTAAVERLGVTDRFKFIMSAGNLEYPKPHPVVYIKAAEKMGVDPTQCLALEDSISGVIAAKAARMTCICVPDNFPPAAKFSVADYLVPSLDRVGEVLTESISSSSNNSKVETVATGESSGKAGGDDRLGG